MRDKDTVSNVANAEPTTPRCKRGVVESTIKGVGMKTIAIDFDGTLHDGQYPEIGALKYGARTVINSITASGNHVIIWTCRSGQRLEEAKEWLRRKDVRYSTINESNPLHIEMYGGDTRKVNADIYIDDKQIGGLPAWNRIGYHLRKAGCMDGLADRIVQRVCDWLKITPSDVKGAVRTAINNDARQLIAILLDDHGLTVGEIAKIINRSRATTIHHIETGHSRAAYGRGFAATLAELRGR